MSEFVQGSRLKVEGGMSASSNLGPRTLNRALRVSLLGAPRGQATVELAMLWAIVVGALVAMLWYLQRGYQGYLYANASAHGLQFDPAGNFTETEAMHYGSAEELYIAFGQQDVDMPTGGNLENIPAQAPSRSLKTTIKGEIHWDVNKKADYNAN